MDTITDKTIQLDVAFDDNETIDNALADMTEGTDIVTSIVNPNGPGGGWPVVEFTGPDAQLRTMLREKYGVDEQEVVELMGD